MRGEDYISVIDPEQLREIDRIPTVDGVSMVAFRPDGQVAFVDSSRVAEVDAIDVTSHQVIARIPVVSPFSPNLLVTPDGAELWLTHKDAGQVTVIDAQTFAVKYVLTQGGSPITSTSWPSSMAITPTSRSGARMPSGSSSVETRRK